MRDDLHAYTGSRQFQSPPRKPFEVIERTKGAGLGDLGKRTDTVTSSLRYAIERRDDLRRTRRPAYVIDKDGRRVEVARWI